MSPSAVAAVFLAAVAIAPAFAQGDAAWHDPSPHRVQFVSVDENVRLEVLDWGGAGRPVVLLSGLGNTAHVFDDFAPKLTGDCHVYGITRLGYGASSAPTSGYDAYRLGADVVAVLDLLKLNKPVLAGHSIAGEELSSVGSRHPDRVAGLVYLDAGYQYAFDNGKGSTLEELQEGAPRQPAPSAADRASFSGLQARLRRVSGVMLPEADFQQTILSKPPTLPGVEKAILAGTQKYTNIPVPVLAIFAVPHDLGPWLEQNSDPAAKAFVAKEAALTEKQAQAFEGGVPSARVVRLPHANHYVFISNEGDVLGEMRVFLATLS
jgi:non-heme chloroperoxidase